MFFLTVANKNTKPTTPQLPPPKKTNKQTKNMSGRPQRRCARCSRPSPHGVLFSGLIQHWFAYLRVLGLWMATVFWRHMLMMIGFSCGLIRTLGLAKHQHAVPIHHDWVWDDNCAKKLISMRARASAPSWKFRCINGYSAGVLQNMVSLRSLSLTLADRSSHFSNFSRLSCSAIKSESRLPNIKNKTFLQ